MEMKRRLSIVVIALTMAGCLFVKAPDEKTEVQNVSLSPLPEVEMSDAERQIFRSPTAPVSHLRIGSGSAPDIWADALSPHASQPVGARSRFPILILLVHAC